VTPAGVPMRWAPIAALAGVLGLRMLGLFLLLPVLALHARAFPDATPFLAGLAVGVYGLTQALLQVPFGAWSDRVGRRRVIVVGLLIFAFGSAVAALADSIWVVILGRALQGAGAISSAATAFAADLTPPGLRTRAMATLGIAVGASFTVAIVVGPPLAGALGAGGLFWSTGALALLAIGLVLATLPDQAAPSAAGGALPRDFYPRLWPVLAGVLLIHALITMVFVTVPGLLADAAGLPLASHWRVYLPAFAAGLVVITAPLVLWSERGRAPAWPQRAAFAAAAAGLAYAALGPVDAAALAIALTLFFGGFNFLEASYPASIAEQVAPEHRGRAMGVYATLQFVGAFCGGALGGALLGLVGPRGALLAAAGIALAAIATVTGRGAPARA
jgi:MFS family permease